MPETGVMMPMRMSDEGAMRREVLAKRMAVDVMVVNPTYTSVNLHDELIIAFEQDR